MVIVCYEYWTTLLLAVCALAIIIGLCDGIATAPVAAIMFKGLGTALGDGGGGV
jgi:hypothetical protein